MFILFVWIVRHKDCSISYGSTLFFNEFNVYFYPFIAKTEIKSDFKCFFFHIYIKKKCKYRFSHNYLVLSLFIHHDKTVISYFMPRHQGLKFSYNLKQKDTM